MSDWIIEILDFGVRSRFGYGENAQNLEFLERQTIMYILFSWVAIEVEC